MFYVDSGVGLYDFVEVLLEEVIVQTFDVGIEDLVGLDFGIRLDNVPQSNNGALRIGLGDLLNGKNFWVSAKLQSLLPIEELIDLILGVPHDFAEDHVLESGNRPRVVVRTRSWGLVLQALEGFEEVAVGRLEVLVLGVEDARHHVDVRQQKRLAVDCVGGSSRGSQGGLGFRVVLDVEEDLALQQVQLHQQVLVVRLPDVHQNGVDDIQSLGRLVGRQIEGGQAELHPVLQRRSLLLDAPLDEVLAQVDLQLLGVGHLGYIVDQVLGDFGSPGLREDVEHVFVSGLIGGYSSRIFLIMSGRFCST